MSERAAVMNVTEPGESLVHFHGAWTRAERATIAQLISRCEVHVSAPIPPSLYGKPWICVKESVNGVYYYIVQRISVTSTWHARWRGCTISWLLHTCRRSS